MENPLERLPLEHYQHNDAIETNIPVKPYAIETLLIEFDKQ